MQISCYNPCMGMLSELEEQAFPSFGALLKYLRRRSGKSQQEVASALDVGQSTLSGWERLAEPPNDPFIVGQISELFDVPADDIRRKVLQVPKRAQPFLANPKEEVIRVAIDLVKPDEADAFLEFTREWVQWPDEWRHMMMQMSRMVTFKEARRKQSRVLGRVQELEESYSTEE